MHETAAAGGKRRSPLLWIVARGCGLNKRSGGLLRATVALAALACSLVVADPAWAQDVPPDETWRTIDTPHFRITFPAELGALGQRAARIAESARTRLAQTSLRVTDDRIEFVLTDHVDASNGFASVAPLRRVVVFARPPVDGFALTNYDDWLDLVIVHELAHVYHLDQTSGVGGLLRGVFGRVPATWPFFPGLGSPRWVIEGLATWYESALTPAGRVRGSVFAMFLRSAALAGELEQAGQVAGNSPVWPDGQRPYLYGSLFFDWLLERHGEEKMGRFAGALAGQWVPYRLDSAARDAFGESFTEAWRSWVDEVEADARALADVIERRSAQLPAPELQTTGARQALHASTSAGGTSAHARVDGRSDTRIALRGPDGEGSIRTNGIATFDWMPDGGLVFAQFERDGPWRTRRDLYRRHVDGSIERLTRAARLDHPAAAADGRWVAAVRMREGHTELVRVDLDDGQVAVVAAGSDSVHWAFPSVSPDGRWIAASRWSPDQKYEVVVVDAADGEVTLRLDPGASIDMAPDWSPDGRWVVWASDRSGIPNLYARTVDPSAAAAGPLRQVTDVVTGTAFPSISPDGRWIEFSLYSAQGWDAARVPFDPAGWRDPVPSDGDAHVTDVDVVAADAGLGPADPTDLGPLDARGYRAIQSLRPRFWEPLLLPEISSRGTRVMGPFVGAGTRLFDLVERHTVTASAAAALDRGNVAAAVGYTWAGLGNPLVSVTAGQSWDAGGPFTAAEQSVFIEERERRVSASVTLLRPRWRDAFALTATAGWLWEDRTLLNASDLRPSETLRLARPSSRLGDLRLSASLNTARGHALSISPERGGSVFVQARTRPQLSLADSLAGVVGTDRSVDEVIGQARGYLSFGGWGWADHVIALRVAAGRAAGPGADAFWYDVGGAAGQGEPVTGLGLFGGQGLFFPVRGYDDGDRSGTRAWVASGEWRFPLLWLNSAWRLLPLHFDRLHGALFADVGNAWGPELEVAGFQNPARDALASVGGEVRLDTLWFYSIPVQFRVGWAARLVGDSGTRLYLRLGRSF